MSETTPQDWLQPFLLERIKDQPDVRQRADRRIVSPTEYRRTLLEDLAALLNSGNHIRSGELKNYPEVAKSVLNYGVTELAGTTSAVETGETVGKMVQNAIQFFKPRILRHTLQVRAVDVVDGTGTHVVELEIRGEIWNYPARIALRPHGGGSGNRPMRAARSVVRGLNRSP